MKKKILNCPDCSSKSFDFTVEDRKMIFFCEDCGFQKIEEHYFYLDGWIVEIRQALAPVDILQALLTDPHIAKILRPRLKGVSYLSSYKDASDDYLLGETEIAYHVYLRQMIVLATTYVELILKEFFRCLFIAQPMRMNLYLSPEGKGKATVTLNEVVNATSSETLVLNLAERAASVAVGPKFDKVVETVIKECTLDLDRPFIKDLKALNEQRNRIIHENTYEETNVQQVHNSFGLLLNLVYVLGQAAEKYQIPYLDETGFMEDFQRQLQK